MNSMPSEKKIDYAILIFGLSLVFCVVLQWINQSSVDIAADTLTPKMREHSLPGDAQALQQATLARLQQDLGDLRQNLERNSQNLQTLGEFAAESAMDAHAQTSQNESTSVAHTDDQPEAGDTATAEEQYLALQARLDQQLATEDYDAHWAPGMQEAITTTLQQEIFLGSELTDLACQSSLCRIDVQHHNANAEDEFLHQFVSAAGFTEGEAFYAREEQSDGSVRMRYYVSRDGQGLAALAQAY